MGQQNWYVTLAAFSRDSSWVAIGCGDWYIPLDFHWIRFDCYAGAIQFFPAKCSHSCEDWFTSPWINYYFPLYRHCLILMTSWYLMKLACGWLTCNNSYGYYIIIYIGIRRTRPVNVLCRQIKKKLYDNVKIVSRNFLKMGNGCFQTSCTFRHSGALSRNAKVPKFFNAWK